MKESIEQMNELSLRVSIENDADPGIAFASPLK